MAEKISELVKKEILRLIAIPGIEVNDIPDQVNAKFSTNLDTEKVMDILSDEYLKHNLDLGRRLCCRF
ncbi:MAG: hypothetical protein EU531_10465 [Promethearchaeota archaeon]|nr:MAG: hypothetical protein EU531_10465 [Candidatus Lokiarchaeota archaeon]